MESHGGHLGYHNPSKSIGYGAINAIDVEDNTIFGVLLDLHLQVGLKPFGVERLILVKVAVGVDEPLLIELDLLFGLLHQQFGL